MWGSVKDSSGEAKLKSRVSEPDRVIINRESSEKRTERGAQKKEGCYYLREWKFNETADIEISEKVIID